MGLSSLADSMSLIITTAAALVLCSPSALQSIQFHIDILGVILQNESCDWFHGVFCFAIAQDCFLDTEGNVITTLAVLRQLFFPLILRSVSSHEIREQYDINNTQQVFLQSMKVSIYLALFPVFQNCKH